MKWGRWSPLTRIARFSTASELPVKKAKHAGAEVVGLDAFPGSLERSQAFVKEWAAKEAWLTELVEEFVQRIKFGDLTDNGYLKTVAPETDFVIEATSSVADSFIRSCMHFMKLGLASLGDAVLRSSRLKPCVLRNPVPVMPLVEVIRGLRTDDATLELTLQLCRAMKKELGW
eukprot:Skav235873  [mRNA]  locus=scaffold1192:32524:34824:- [translate_table: standard]